MLGPSTIRLLSLIVSASSLMTQGCESQPETVLSATTSTSLYQAVSALTVPMQESILGQATFSQLYGVSGRAAIPTGAVQVGDVTAVWPQSSAQEINTYLAALDRQYGSVSGYATSRAGVTDLSEADFAAGLKQLLSSSGGDEASAARVLAQLSAAALLGKAMASSAAALGLVTIPGTSQQSLVTPNFIAALNHCLDSGYFDLPERKTYTGDGALWGLISDAAIPGTEGSMEYRETFESPPQNTIFVSPEGKASIKVRGSYVVSEGPSSVTYPTACQLTDLGKYAQLQVFAKRGTSADLSQIAVLGGLKEGLKAYTSRPQ